MNLNSKIILKELDLFVPGVADFSVGNFNRIMALPDLINNKVYIFEAQLQ